MKKRTRTITVISFLLLVVSLFWFITRNNLQNPFVYDETATISYLEESWAWGHYKNVVEIDSKGYLNTYFEDEKVIEKSKGFLTKDEFYRLLKFVVGDKELFSMREGDEGDAIDGSTSYVTVKYNGQTKTMGGYMYDAKAFLRLEMRCSK